MSEAASKTGLSRLKAGTLLFREGEQAKSLYIVQKGQIRLFRPKGKGFIELAVLRAGEVLGEMAYFEQNSKRSCSAEAMVESEIIEISFEKFSNAIEKLNPWFKTIVMTLSDRLRDSNKKIKELESNSMAGGYGTKGVSTYKYLQNVDVIKSLSVLYFIYKGMGVPSGANLRVHLDMLKFYAQDIFNIHESKFEEFLNLLEESDLLKRHLDQNKFPKILETKDPEVFNKLTKFFNTQRMKDESEQLSISDNCELLLLKIIDHLSDKGVEGNQEKVRIDIMPIINDLKMQGINADVNFINDAVTAGFVTEPVIDRAGIIVEIFLKDLLDKVPEIKLLNRINRLNESKV